ncbi:hypothetical protein LCGC14_1656810 [marine sediment metagenome]|uniref:UspA domain-containing protein n=1 Tax=marine sediment metagenome TaxID=412755 RepID=A0A0F9IHM6_9ZZZZ
MIKILIPTDFSNNAMHALRYAIALFKWEEAQFYLLHAYANEVYDDFRPNSKTDVEVKETNDKKNSKNRFDRLIKDITEGSSNHNHVYKSLNAFDALVVSVKDAVKEKSIDLVIMGTKGKTNDKKIIFGSNTMQVLKYVQCPVLIIPHDAVIHNPKRILLPTDFMLPYKPQQFKVLNYLGNEYKAEINSLYISDFEDISHRQLENKRVLIENLSDSFLFFERTGIKNRIQAIREHILLRNIDFLVMVDSKHSFLEDLLYRSTIDELGLTIKIPFLVL